MKRASPPCRQRPTRCGAAARLMQAHALGIVASLPGASMATLAARLRRFVRWFFNSSPTAQIDVSPRLLPGVLPTAASIRAGKASR